MAKIKNLEEQRKDHPKLIKQEIVSYEETAQGMIMVRKAVRHYYKDDDSNYHDSTFSEPLSMWQGHPTDDSMRKQK